MDPDGTPGRDWSLPAGTAGHEFVETEVTELVAAVGGEDHIAERRRGEQSAQRFEPADKPPTAFGSRLPPRAARRHDDDRRFGRVISRDCDGDVARSARRSPTSRAGACFAAAASKASRASLESWIAGAP